MLFTQRLRQRASRRGHWRETRWAKVAEAVALSIAVMLIFYSLPLAGVCKPRPDEEDKHAPRRRRLVGGERTYRRYGCSDDGATGACLGASGLL